jgi:hypothetical protein
MESSTDYSPVFSVLGPASALESLLLDLGAGTHSRARGPGPPLRVNISPRISENTKPLPCKRSGMSRAAIYFFLGDSPSPIAEMVWRMSVSAAMFLRFK